MFPRFKRKLLKYKKLIALSFVAAITVVVATFLIRLGMPLYRFVKVNRIDNQLIKSLIFNSVDRLDSYQGRINAVILGISGGNHDGMDLTDTIIFISTDFEKNDALMLSIPRDLWIPFLKAKVNSAYHYGEKKKPEEGGLILAKSAIEEVVGRPIHYAFVIDFSGFKEIIDLIGGIDVTIENSFEDKKYPLEGKEDDFCGGDPEFSCRYETVVFEKGIEHMSGDRALKFVRSRNSEDGEGTDFARSKRQQKIILALKNKLLEVSTWTDTSRMGQMIDMFNKTVKTDMDMSELAIYIKNFSEISSENIRRLVLEQDTTDSAAPQEKVTKGYLINPPIWEYDGQWVLAPKDGNFDTIHQYISCHLENTNCQMAP